MKSIIKLSILFLLLILVPILSSYGNIQIEIKSGMNKIQPIMIFPFQLIGQNNLQYKIENIIATDLKNSGKFIIHSSSILRDNNKIMKLIPNFWKKFGINFIIKGSIKYINNNDYNIFYKLIDVTNYPYIPIISNNFVIKKKLLRYFAHKISDEIFEKLTGIKGAFRTHIAYVVKYYNNQNHKYELRIADYDGYNQFTIHKSKEPLMSPSWSCDGNKIAYVTFEYDNNSSIVIQNLKTGKIQKIISFKKHNGAPAFSPDGMKLAFVLSKTGSLNLYVMNLVNGKIKQLTNTSYNNNTEPSWMPDSKSIIYTSDQDGKTQIYKININDKNQERITWNTNWSQNPAVSHNGNFIVMVSLNDKKQSIIKQDLITGEIKYLTDSVLNESPSISPNDNMIIYNNASQTLNTMLQIISSNGRNTSSIVINDGQVKFPTWSPYCS